MKIAEIRSLEQYAEGHGLTEIPESIDTDGCDCEPCIEEARATIRMAKGTNEPTGR
jgi:hypothetical protein